MVKLIEFAGLVLLAATAFVFLWSIYLLVGKWTWTAYIILGAIVVTTALFWVVKELVGRNYKKGRKDDNLR